MRRTAGRLPLAWWRRVATATAFLTALDGIPAQDRPLPPLPETAGDSAVPASVSGQILRVTAAGERPVPRQWVIVHGIGVAGGHAIDSTRTIADGSFRLRYMRDADATAQYFISTVHHGIAYVSGVLPLNATPDDATLTVFDTTSARIPLAVRGRHILIFAPTDTPRRRVAEIYDLSNDTTVTRVAGGDGAPLWTAALPAGAQDFSSGPDLSSNEAITMANGRVTAFSPVAPGLKRIAFTYALPPTAFPLTVWVEYPTEVFEVLIEDRRGEVIGPGLVETAPSNIEGRMFRRFQAQDMAAASVVTVRVPAAPAAPRETNEVLIVALGVVMLAALVIALRRARARPAPARQPALPIPETEADVLVREIAALDAAFERDERHDDAARARYQEQREQLKRRLADRLAAQRQA